MRKAGIVAFLTTLILLMSSVCVFADGGDFQLLSTYPEDNQTNTTKDNMCVKLQFNKSVGTKDETVEANKDTYKITDSKGNELPTRILYNPKDTKEVLVVVDTVKLQKKEIKIKDEEVYKLTISKDFQDDEGQEVGKDIVVRFKTLNQSRSQWIYMGMMIIMFGAIFIISARQMRKHEEEDSKNPLEDAFNPYKEAKRTGKTVEEVMAEHQKEVERYKKKAERKAKKSGSVSEAVQEDDREIFRVKGPRPIAVAGGKTISGRKALAEERKRKKAEQAAQKSNKTTKNGKNYKSRKRK